jgi:hypothetical protein
MRLYLINPRNPLVGLTDLKVAGGIATASWRPLGLMALAALTPPEWGNHDLRREYPRA